MYLAESLHWADIGRAEEARALFETAASTVSDPGLQVRALYDLGEVLASLHQLSRSLRLLTYVIDTYPAHPSIPQVHALRSETARELGKWDLAVADARAYLAAPNFNDYSLTCAHLVLAEQASRSHDLATAETEYRTALQFASASPDNREFWDQAQLGLAACKVGTGDVAGALQIYLEAADGDPRSKPKALFLFFAAEAAERLGDSATRERIIARMVAEVPGSPYTTKLVGHDVLPAPDL